MVGYLAIHCVAQQGCGVPLIDRNYKKWNGDKPNNAQDFALELSSVEVPIDTLK